jgi:hypothetical protein
MSCGPIVATQQREHKGLWSRRAVEDMACGGKGTGDYLLLDPPVPDNPQGLSSPMLETGRSSENGCGRAAGKEFVGAIHEAAE